MANINNEQRKNLARIVEQNGTYSDFYQTKFADADKKLVAEHKVAIGKHADLVIALAKAKEAKEEAIKKITEQHNVVVAKAEKAEKSARNAIKAQGLSYDEPYSYRYGGCDDDDEEATDKKEAIVNRWKADSGRFSSEYTKWQKELIASIWASDTVATAKALVKEFLSASGKTLDIKE